MIGYLKGNILFAKDNSVIIETNGVGFEVQCSSAVFDKLLNAKTGEAFIYTAVKEDGISLYGFVDIEEKNMFLKLISISGVGPKMAISILSNMAINDLVVKIATSDVKGLSKIKGLGKKTAERIILELREKVGEFENDDGCFAPSDNENSEDKDAVIALMSLGFTTEECTEAIKKAHESNAKNINELISLALKNMR